MEIKTWTEAHAWADCANIGKEEDCDPMWSWDCGFKLDFDGPLLSVSSRFYPPFPHYGPKWDGSVDILFFDTPIFKKSFECDTLDELKNEVEKYVKDFASRLNDHLSSFHKKEGELWK